MNRFSLTLLMAALGGTGAVYAQQANPLSTEAKQAYTAIKNNLTKMAESMPEEQYNFKPTPEIRSFGELMAHVAAGNARYCSMAMGGSKSVDTSKTAKADVLAELKEAFAICDSAFDSLADTKATEMVKMGRMEMTKLGVLLRNIAHDNEEYGYGAVYMRLKGVVPPTSAGRGAR